MKTYRLKPPTFEARQITGTPEDLTSGLFEWLGDTAKVLRADSKSVLVSVRFFGLKRCLKPGEWVVRASNGKTLSVVTNESFQRDFEVVE